MKKQTTESNNSLGRGVNTLLAAETPSAHQALLVNEAKLETITDTVPVLILMTDIEASCIFVNQAWINYSGRSLKDELGNGWKTIIHPDDFKKCITNYSNAFTNRNIFKIEFRLRRADGIYRWFFATGAPRYDSGSNFVGYISSCIDITDHKNTELVLWESKELYRSFFENTIDGILLTTLDGIIIAANPAACRLLGRSENELVKVCLSFFGSDNSGWDSLIQERTAFGKAQGQTWIKHKKGAKIFVEVSTTLFSDRNGIPKNLVVIRDMTRQMQMKEELEKYRHHLEDLVQEYLKELKQVNHQLEMEITERKQAEAELQASNTQIASILESITDGFFAVDSDWRLTYLNKEAERLWNKSRLEVLGQYLWDVFPEAVGSQFYSRNLQALEQQVAIHYEVFLNPLINGLRFMHILQVTVSLYTFAMSLTASLQKKNSGKANKSLKHL